ncbi:MAG: metalloregulator ArsR/SmtB family transcription factor [Acidimicrobiales bacterium]
MDLALKALAEPRRRAILRLVRDGELSSGEIASQFDVTGPAISQHLGVLKEAGLVHERRAGTRRLYRARPEGMADVRRFVEDFWDVRLDRLRDAAEQAQRDNDNDTHDDKETRNG